MERKINYRLSDFEDLKSAGKNYVATCPKCGTRHLSISKDKGVFHCFYAGCDFKGILAEFATPKPAFGAYDSGASQPSTGSRHRMHAMPEVETEVPLIPQDYKTLQGSILEKIKPLLPAANDLTDATPDADQLAARHYLEQQHISVQTAINLGVGCLRHVCNSKNAPTSSNYHCIAYVNTIGGKPVNVKYRSVDELKLCATSGHPPAESGQAAEPVFTKCWSQDAPTSPCPPYNIDCINPLRVPEACIEKLIITEGEKDVLSLCEAGFRYAVSIPNGAAANVKKVFEAFVPWLDDVRDVVICSDTDLPGRTLCKHLVDYFGARSMVVTMPEGCKDISDVLRTYGAEAVREVVDKAAPVNRSNIVHVADHRDRVMAVLEGNYDKGYDVGYGELTDHVLHPDDAGGLMIVTGEPNAGKTDFLNDLTCRLMTRKGKYVAFLSFELPDKAKHIARLANLTLGRKSAKGITQEQVGPVLDYLERHMALIDMYKVEPTVQNILNISQSIMRSSPLKYLIIDPYLFVSVPGGGNLTETQAIKAMLTTLQAWGRANKVWVMVAHPRQLHKVGESNQRETIDMYTIAGSANWANLADFIFSLARVRKDGMDYTRLDMLKVRDQDLCSVGSVLYVRQPCGRYDERESEEQIRDEAEGKVLPKDTQPFLTF